MTTIKLKNGSGAPTAGDLVQGEPALDLTNKRLYTEDSGGTVIEVGTNPTSITTGDITATGTVSFAGLGTTGDVTFGDNDKAIFGAGSDLQLYHSGTESWIKDAGTGGLYIDTDGTSVLLTSGNTAKNMVTAVKDGAVTLYNNNSAKLATTSTGIDVTGSVTADGLTVDGNGELKQTSSGGEVKPLRVTNSTTTTGSSASLVFNLSTVSSDNAKIEAKRTNSPISSDTELNFYQLSNGTMTLRQKIATNGDISFYNSAGTSQDLYWDASASSLGLGTTSPDSSYKLHVQGNLLATGNARIEGSRIRIVGGGSAAAPSIQPGNDGDTGMFHAANNTIGFSTAGTERMRIDSSGNLLVSKTTSAIATEGVTLGGGQHYFTTDGDAAVKLNRLSSDGEIVQLRKDGSTVGSIGTGSGAFFIGGGDTNLTFNPAGDNIYPSVSGSTAVRDAAVDLGTSIARFKDLYLSGSVNLGSTTSLTESAGGDTQLVNTNTGADVFLASGRRIRFNTAGSEAARLDSSGNLLVGATTAYARLHVKDAADKSESDAHIAIEGLGYSAYHWLDASAYYIGQNSAYRAVRIYSGAETAGVALTNGSTSWGTFSDERLKYDVEPIDNALQSLSELRTIKYRLKDVDEPDSQKKLGVVAQDLVGVLDEVVEPLQRNGDDTEYMAVRYTELVPVLIKAVQEQQDIIENLKSRIEQLEGAN